MKAGPLILRHILPGGQRSAGFGHQEGEGGGDGAVGETGDEDEGIDDEGEPDADPDAECELEQLREQALPITDRSRLAEGRAFLCWDNKEKTSFFPIVLTEDWAKGTQKIKCACLEKQADSVYTIDPMWKGDSSASKDKAFINLIFEVGGEGLREIAAGLETPTGVVRAWKMQRVTRQ